MKRHSGCDFFQSATEPDSDQQSHQLRHMSYPYSLPSKALLRIGVLEEGKTEHSVTTTFKKAAESLSVLRDAREERNWSHVGMCAGNTHASEDNPGAA